MSMLSDFLKENEIPAEDVVARSQTLEARHVEDRATATARANARRTKDKKSYEELGLAKPSALGRGVSDRLLEKALAGEPLSRINRKKIVRSVNSLLLSKGQSEIEWRALFSDTPSKKGKSK